VDCVVLSTAKTNYRALLSFLRGAVDHANGSLIFAAALLGSARAATLLLEGWIRGDIQPLTALYRLVPSEITATCMVIAVLIAEQCVRNGARRLSAYLPAVIGAAALAGLVSTPLILLMRRHGVPMAQSHAEIGTLGTVLYYSTDSFARGGLAAWIFANRESFLGSLGKLQAAELARAQSERDLENARYLAKEAMMQPEALISALTAVRRLYEEDHFTADNRLAAFIEHLRTVSVQVRA
jgi:hypothetical protein